MIYRLFEMNIHFPIWDRYDIPYTVTNSGARLIITVHIDFPSSKRVRQVVDYKDFRRGGLYRSFTVLEDGALEMQFGSASQWKLVEGDKLERWLYRRKRGLLTEVSRILGEPNTTDLMLFTGRKPGTGKLWVRNPGKLRIAFEKVEDDLDRMKNTIQYLRRL